MWGVRLCCDFRLVNEGTYSDGYPMPRADDLLRTISRSNFISTLDCSQGYWQVQMNPDDIQKTAFVTHKGQYEWLVMPFGLKCAGNTFQRMSDDILKDHSSYARSYIDDTAVHSDSWEDHLLHLDRVLTAFEKEGLTLKLSKCAFGKNKIKYIGHIIGSGEIKPIESKIQAIIALPEPTSKKLLKSYLGMTSYYRNFIPDFANIARPLTEMTKLRCTNQFKFNIEQRAAFEKLREMLGSSKVLVPPRFDRPFIIQTDASDYAVGACLAQLDDKNIEHPILFVSSKLSPTQCRWSVIEKESFAVIFALSKFDHIVFGNKIDLYSDHNPLKHLVSCTPRSAKLTRWALSLQHYDITVHYRKGIENVVPDCLSRLI